MGHGIFGWDLPPGVSVSDIPGNRPEDVRWEAIYENFWDKERLANANGIRITEDKYAKMDKIWKSNSKINREFVDLLDDYIIAAIEYGMEIGRKEAQNTIQENKYYDSEYHQRVRNPKLIAFFKAQRQQIKSQESMKTQERVSK